MTETAALSLLSALVGPLPEELALEASHTNTDPVDVVADRLAQVEEAAEALPAGHPERDRAARYRCRLSLWLAEESP